MKIAFLSFFSGLVNRGVETYVHELASKLQVRQEVVVYQSKSDATIKSFTKRVLAEIDPQTDIVIATNGGWQSLLCRLWCWKNGKKLVIPGQSGPGRDDRFNLFTFPDVFVALTTFQKQWVRKTNPLVKTIKIPNGVDVEKFRPGVEPVKLDLPRPVILSVAALDESKRLGLIIKAVAKLKRGSLVLVGRGPEEENLKRLGNRLLAGRFKVLSFSHEQMPPVYAAADLFTYATVPWESFGIVMLEAMASGLAVVATDDPIRREVVGPAGYFVNPKKSEEYAKVLQKALETKWGNKPRKQAEKFAWDKVAAEYEVLLKETGSKS